MKLYLLRHGQAEMYAKSRTDFDRKLTSTGRKQALWVRNKLKFFNQNPARVYASSAQRTMETAAIVTENLNDFKVTYEKILYNASVEDLLQFLTLKLKNVNMKGKEVMIVAHNNGLSEFASYLIDDYVVLPPCGLVVLTFLENFSVEMLGERTGVKNEIVFAPSEIY